MDSIDSDTPSAANLLSSIDTALNSLRKHDWSASWKTAEELAKIGTPAVPRLIEALSDKDGYIREAAANALGMIGNKSAVEPLIRALQYRDEQVYEDDEDSEARMRAALALGRIGDPQAFDPLIKAISEDDMQLSWYAIEALGMLRDPRAIPVLITTLEHPDIDRRKSASSALVKFGDAAIMPLINIAKDTNRKWRIFAIKALGEIGDTRAIKALNDLLNDEDETVRLYAAESVNAIKEKQET
jgi:HEAT repeat protein